jgi:hypothetical protein
VGTLVALHVRDKVMIATLAVKNRDEDLEKRHEQDPVLEKKDES